MPVNGPLSHIDLSVSDSARSIAFYEALLGGLGFMRFPSDEPGFGGVAPERAAWFLQYGDSALFGIELRPSRGENRERPSDRYSPGVHHLAFHAESREVVDRVCERVAAVGGEVLDAPDEYTGPAYGGGYYAAFFADPDGVKLEVVYHPPTNP